MKCHDWETPPDFFKKLNERYMFDLDVCATWDTAKVEDYFSLEDDGLNQEWYGCCWMNPPYDQTIGKWVEKAWRYSQNGGKVVCLLPGRSNDTKWWHRFVMKSSKIIFIEDRLHFGKNGIFKRANISSVLVVFEPFCEGPPSTEAINRFGVRTA